MPGWGSVGFAEVALSLALGAAFGAYAVLQPQTLGCGFPKLSSDIAMRPTFGRVAIFLLGRWVGFVLLGLLAGGLHLALETVPFIPRLLLAAEILLAVFMLLFLVTGNSPEIKAAQWLNPEIWSIPLGIKGLLSSWALTAPACVALCYVLLSLRPLEGMLYFTNVFLGNALVLLPLILNIPWAKAKNYQFFTRLIILFCLCAVFFFSISQLLKS